jgi:hypothetical protein
MEADANGEKFVVVGKAVVEKAVAEKIVEARDVGVGKMQRQKRIPRYARDRDDMFREGERGLEVGRRWVRARKSLGDFGVGSSGASGK